MPPERRNYNLPGRNLVSQEDAAKIENARVPRSRFTNSWSRKTTFDAGYIVPFLIDEILPGDHMRYDVEAYIRMSTPLFPLFDNQRIDTFFFFVPNRLVWESWVKFMGEQANPGDTIAYTMPQVGWTVVPPAVGSIYDHFGLPIQAVGAGGIAVNVLPLRAYNMIWNAWFRDENIQNSVPEHKGGSGSDSIADYVLLKRAKSHDYFTSALPWPQKFTPLQTLFTGTAPVIGIGVKDGAMTGAGGAFRQADGSIGIFTGFTAAYEPAGSTYTGIRFDANANVSASNPPKIYADLAQATGVTINALRNAWLVQDLLERDARGGTRYTELIRSHFGVVNPDFRLQRPEYIGGGSTPLNITPIAQTTPTGGGGLGALGGAGTASGSHRASYAATEHGYIIGLINIRSEISYQQGIPRHFSKTTRYDYYWPSLAGLGEQSILRREIYATGVAADDTTVFGYQERWHEYRTKYSEVTGLFRSTAAGNIDEWHLAQEFTAPPTLSTTFIQDTPPMDRVLAAGALAQGMQYLADIQMRRIATRPVPTYGTPATLARF